MKLLPLSSAELIELVAGWLDKPDNYKWLDFGNGVQMVTPITLKIMTQRDIHVFRAYTADHGDVPVGVVGLTNVDRHFKTASIWAVLGAINAMAAPRPKRVRGCSRVDSPSWAYTR